MNKPGKGAAIRTALALATGDVVVVQDDPDAWMRVPPHLVVRAIADVCYRRLGALNDLDARLPAHRRFVG